jgi:dTDP-4-amino-4,6-dideoxy-D-galactose acyltransferase
MLHPKPLIPEALADCASLLEAYPFKPYRSYSQRAGESALRHLFLSRIEAGFRGGTLSVLWVPGANAAQGLAAWTRLAWDSQQLGVGAGRLDWLVASGDYQEQYTIKEALLTAILEACADQSIRHLSARVDASDLSSIHLLEEHGFITVDSILTFSLDIGDARWPSPPEGLEIGLSRPEDIEQLKAIARSSYAYGRFHSDPQILKAVADELHAVWLENSCLRKAADAVIAAAENGRILGFVTCKIDRRAAQYLGLIIGTIVLVATAPEARGCGVARATIYGSLDWFRGQGVDIVEVGTQLRNIPASRLYEACGFRLVASSISLRKWME